MTRGGSSDRGSSSSDRGGSSDRGSGGGSDRRSSTAPKARTSSFNVSTALFLGGLAFDAYLEPAAHSARWERGSGGLDVAYSSPLYARQLYRGVLALHVERVTDLPSESENVGTVERLVSGAGVDACVLAAVVEGAWLPDVERLEQSADDQHDHTGVADLTGAAHVVRTRTCWASVDAARAEQSARKNGVPLPHHVPAAAGWGQPGAAAVWPASELPLYLYVQEPASARLVLTVVDDDALLAFGQGGNANANANAVGSTHRKLSDLIPQVALPPAQLVQHLKERVLEDVARRVGNNTNGEDGPVDAAAAVSAALDAATTAQLGACCEWRGALPLTTKPRQRDKNGRMWAGAAAGAVLAGPWGAAAGAAVANWYERPVRGVVHVRLRYRPLLLPGGGDDDSDSDSGGPASLSPRRRTYTVRGGMPGIDWGALHHRHHHHHSRRPRQQLLSSSSSSLTPTISPTRDDAGASVNVTVMPPLAESENAAATIETESPSVAVISSNSATFGSGNDGNSDVVVIDAPRNDLEHCFFVTHRQTGATCAVYRSWEQKMVVVSFRGTCAPIDLFTDASLIQEAWVAGEDTDDQSIPKVHVGFRSSLNSIARRLKELLLAVPAPGESIADYDMYVTGHSLGAALATLFTADVGQYGMDAGRGLPQLEESEDWWKAILNTFTGGGGSVSEAGKEPPRPRSLRLYNFGSPRVGNVPFAELFDALRDEGYIDQAYRVVNGDDVVARLPRSVNAFVFGNINYEHVGTTVLLTPPPTDNSDDTTTTNVASNAAAAAAARVIWIEGESDDNQCPVRDGVALTSPMAEGSLLRDLFAATRETLQAASDGDDGTAAASSLLSRLSSAAGRVTDRLKQVSASDLATIVGIDQSFTDREWRMIQSLVQGKALAHHLEDEYYAGMGRAAGFAARVGEELQLLVALSDSNVDHERNNDDVRSTSGTKETSK